MLIEGLDPTRYKQLTLEQGLQTAREGQWEKQRFLRSLTVSERDHPPSLRGRMSSILASVRRQEENRLKV